MPVGSGDQADAHPLHDPRSEGAQRACLEHVHQRDARYDGQQGSIRGSWKALAEGDYRWVVEIDGDTEGFGAVFANVLNFDPTFDIVTP